MPGVPSSIPSYPPGLNWTASMEIVSPPSCQLAVVVMWRLLPFWNLDSDGKLFFCGWMGSRGRDSSSVFKIVHQFAMPEASEKIAHNYSSPKNHGSGKWLYLKGNYYYWRDPNFTEPWLMGGRVVRLCSTAIIGSLEFVWWKYQIRCPSCLGEGPLYRIWSLIFTQYNL